MMDLTGKTAVVTGASSGIGRAVAQRLVDAGVRVALVGRSEERLREAASGWPSDAWLALPCDVRDSAAVQAMATRAEQELSRVDILVNSAGVFKAVLLTELDDETWRELWETNVNGTLFPTRALLPGMVERGLGYVVIISSVAAAPRLRRHDRLRRDETRRDRLRPRPHDRGAPSGRACR